MTTKREIEKIKDRYQYQFKSAISQSWVMDLRQNETAKEKALKNIADQDSKDTDKYLVVIARYERVNPSVDTRSLGYKHWHIIKKEKSKGGVAGPTSKANIIRYKPVLDVVPITKLDELEMDNFAVIYQPPIEYSEEQNNSRKKAIKEKMVRKFDEISE